MSESFPRRRWARLANNRSSHPPLGWRDAGSQKLAPDFTLIMHISISTANRRCHWVLCPAVTSRAAMWCAMRMVPAHSVTVPAPPPRSSLPNDSRCARSHPVSGGAIPKPCVLLFLPTSTADRLSSSLAFKPTELEARALAARCRVRRRQAAGRSPSPARRRAGIPKPGMWMLQPVATATTAELKPC